MEGRGPRSSQVFNGCSTSLLHEFAHGHFSELHKATDMSRQIWHSPKIGIPWDTGWSIIPVKDGHWSFGSRFGPVKRDPSDAGELPSSGGQGSPLVEYWLTGCAVLFSDAYCISRYPKTQLNPGFIKFRWKFWSRSGAPTFGIFPLEIIWKSHQWEPPSSIIHKGVHFPSPSFPEGMQACFTDS